MSGRGKPAAIRLAEHEHGEALARLAKAKARLAQAEEWLVAAENIERGSRRRLQDVREAYGLDIDGNRLLELS